MISKKRAYLAAAIVVGATLMTVPVQARFGRGFGGMHVGGFEGTHPGGFGATHPGGFGGGFVGHTAFVGRPEFINHGFSPGHRFAFFPHRRFSFFPRHRFVAPFFGVGALYAAG